STLTLGAQQTMSWNTLGVRPTLSMQGTMVRNSLGTMTTITGVELANTGTVRVQSGTLRTDTVQNVSGGTLTGGTWEEDTNSTLDFVGQPVTTNQPHVILDGAGSTFNAINGLTTNGSAGQLEVKNGRTFTTAGTFTNNGTVNVVGTTGPALFKVATGS